MMIYPQPLTTPQRRALATIAARRSSNPPESRLMQLSDDALRECASPGYIDAKYEGMLENFSDASDEQKESARRKALPYPGLSEPTMANLTGTPIPFEAFAFQSRRATPDSELPNGEEVT